MVTAAQKIMKNSNYSYFRNVLRIKLLKLQPHRRLGLATLPFVGAIP